MNLSIKQKPVAPLFILMLLFCFAAINNGQAANINKPFTDTTRDAVFSRVEMQPQFPGGLQAFGAFLGQNIHYPADDARNKIEGRVICTFVVEKDGTLSNIKVIRTPTEAMGKEAVRVLSLSPAWKPGYQGGKLVRVSYTVPISFSLGKG
ncbi:energy transducer TonB [Mucilaginibacter sp. UR6-11]|uniref:energy transducer TonB n=1 Tax=Mucilaginibacter sp. UR6-11 TaxID=1435644 RepID=UPI001E3193EF|nr:energy transducer TonB [Mucilaginibacter sp. UR6-11]MCC8426891.1 energy transducer TonB [Mucilaginibacter sp. UR6-11]